MTAGDHLFQTMVGDKEQTLRTTAPWRLPRGSRPAYKPVCCPVPGRFLAMDNAQVMNERILEFLHP